MSNWIEEKIARNKEIASQIIPDLIALKLQNSKDKKIISPIISELEKGEFNEDYLLKVRNDLRRLVTKDEHNLIKKKDAIWELNNKIRRLENKYFEESYSDIEAPFEIFDFKIGANYYYLKFSKLNIYQERLQKSEKMIDSYIQDFLTSFLSDYSQKSQKNLEVFDSFSIVFLHHLTTENAGKYDTDNINISKPINGINSRLVKNDLAIMMDVFQIIVPDESEFTEMYVLKGHGLGLSIRRLLSDLK